MSVNLHSVGTLIGRKLADFYVMDEGAFDDKKDISIPAVLRDVSVEKAIPPESDIILDDRSASALPDRSSLKSLIRRMSPLLIAGLGVGALGVAEWHRDRQEEKAREKKKKQDYGLGRIY
jgi:hypothetical protein